MKNAITIFILSITCVSVFKSATPFLSYKMNYEFILKERCEFRGTSQHDDCDGFCYLRKKIEHQHGGDHEVPHSDNAIPSHKFSSIYGILENNQEPNTPLLNKNSFQVYSSSNTYKIYLEILSPPPKT